jgi:hypothetical protein
MAAKATNASEATSRYDVQSIEGEPDFVLCGRDALAPWLVRAWSLLRRCQIYLGTKPPSDFDKADQALDVARQMRAWRKSQYR